MNVLAVLWDVDGTLINSAEQLFKDCCRAAQKLGLRIPPREEFLTVWALPWAQLLKALWPNISEEVFNERFEEQSAQAVSGARRVLLKLKKDGHFLAVISNRERLSLKERMEHVGMPFGLFDYVQAVDDFEFAKPDPRVFNRALLLLSNRGIPRSKVIFIGDALADFQAAKEAHIEFVAVLTGGVTKGQFLVAGLNKSHILESVRDLPKFLT